MLRDIATLLTGGQFISEGPRPQARASRRSTSSAARPRSWSSQGRHHDHRGRRQEEADIKARCEQHPRADREDHLDYDREKLQERLAKLTGGVAIIRVGAMTEADMKEKQGPRRGRPQRDPRGRRRGLSSRRRRRVPPCHPGGRPRRSKVPRATRRSASTSSPRRLEAPARRSPRTPAKTARRRRRRGPGSKEGHRGFAAISRQVVTTSMWSRPASSTRPRSCAHALQNAASIAGLMLTTNTMVTDLKDEGRSTPDRRTRSA